MEPKVTVPAASTESAAILDAIALYRQPMLARKMIATALPEGMRKVLKIAAEGDESASLLADEVGATSKELHEACLVYLRTVVFHQHATDTRLLALVEPVAMPELRNHKRMIFKWLHPDRNHNSWESKLFLRVKAATLRLEQAAQIQSPLTAEPEQLTKIARRPHGRKNLHHIRRLPTPGFWQRMLLNKAVPIVLAMLVLAAGGWAVLAMTTGNHGFDYAYEAAN